MFKTIKTMLGSTQPPAQPEVEKKTLDKFLQEKVDGSLTENIPIDFVERFEKEIKDFKEDIINKMTKQTVAFSVKIKGLEALRRYVVRNKNPIFRAPEIREDFKKVDHSLLEGNFIRNVKNRYVPDYIGEINLTTRFLVSAKNMILTAGPYFVVNPYNDFFKDSLKGVDLEPFYKAYELYEKFQDGLSENPSVFLNEFTECIGDRYHRTTFRCRREKRRRERRIKRRIEELQRNINAEAQISIHQNH